MAGDATGRATALLARAGGLRGLEHATPDRLARIPGIAEQDAVAVCAAVELGRRVVQCQVPYARVIANPDNVAEFLRTSIGDAKHERILVLGLDTRRHIQLVRTIAQGALTPYQVS